MPDPDPSSSFDTVLAMLAHAPDEPLQRDHLPLGQSSATLVAGRYRVERLLGWGGMGEVYFAIDERLERPVALKLARADLSKASARKWGAEAEALASIAHPNVVEVYEVGAHNGRPYIVMERIVGETLGHWVELRRPSWETILECYQQAARGLAAAHAVGLVHRDFKPANALRGEDGRVRVVDFGLAGRIAAHPTSEQGERRTDSDASNPEASTQSPAGTAGYIAPEQLAGHRPDPRSDQFSWCASLFEALAGRPAFSMQPASDLRERMQTGPSEPPITAGGPRWVWGALRRGLDPSPIRRFASMGLLLQALDPVRRRRRRGAMMLTASALGGIVIASQAWSPDVRDVCASEDLSLATVWNPQRAAQIHATFLATESPVAAAASGRVAVQLDAFAKTWGERRQEACRARQRGGVSTVAHPSVACLERLRTNASAAIGTLGQVGRREVPNAEKMIEELRSPDECTAVAGNEGKFDEASETTLAAQVALAEAKAQTQLGRAVPAKRSAAEALRAAMEATSDPLIAEALLARGRVAALDSRTAGLVDFQQAYWTAVAARSDRTAADASRAALNAISDRDPRRWDKVERWWGLALSAEVRVNPDDAPSWQLLRARAGAALDAEHFTDAQTHYERALATAEKRGVAARARVGLLTDLSASAYSGMRFEEALSWADKALEVGRRQLPRPHPALARALRYRAAALRPTDPEAALGPAHECTNMRRTIYGLDSLLLLEALSTLSEVQTSLGNYDDAVGSLEESLAILERRPDSPTFLRGQTHYSLGLAHLSARRFNEATEAFEASAAHYGRAQGADAINGAYALTLLAEIAVERQELELAEQRLDSAIDVVERVQPASLSHIGIMSNRADVRRGLGRLDEAMEDYDEMLSMLGEGSDEAGVRASIVSGRAGVFIQRGQFERAIGSIDNLLVMERARLPAASLELAASHREAAYLYLQASAPAKAREAALGGLRILSKLGRLPEERSIPLGLQAAAAAATCGLLAPGEHDDTATQISKTHDPAELERLWFLLPQQCRAQSGEVATANEPTSGPG